MAFPAAPTDGDLHTEGAVIYRWVASANAWVIEGPVTKVIGKEFIAGDGTVGPVVIPHGLTLDTATRLDITTNSVATGQPVTVGVTNDATNITLTGDVPIPVNGVFISAHVVDP